MRGTWKTSLGTPSALQVALGSSPPLSYLLVIHFGPWLNATQCFMLRDDPARVPSYLPCCNLAILSLKTPKPGAAKSRKVRSSVLLFFHLLRAENHQHSGPNGMCKAFAQLQPSNRDLTHRYTPAITMGRAVLGRPPSLGTKRTPAQQDYLRGTAVSSLC